MTALPDVLDLDQVEAACVLAGCSSCTQQCRACRKGLPLHGYSSRACGRWPVPGLLQQVPAGRMLWGHLHHSDLHDDCCCSGGWSTVAAAFL